MQEPYEKPQVKDFGTIVEVTKAVAFQGAEDGGSKNLIHHESLPL